MPEDKLTFTDKNEVPLKEDVDSQDPVFWEPNKAETEIVRRVMSRVEEDMYPHQQVMHSEWDDATQTYEAYIEPRKNRPNFSLPISHMLIESALAEEVDAFPDIELEVNDDDDRSKLPILNAAKKYAMYRTNWEGIKIDARRICRIYGICPVRISYVRETRKIKERKVVAGDEGAMIQYEEKWDYPVDDIKMEVIDNPRRFLIDPNIRDLNDDRREDCALFTTVGWNAYKQKVQHNRFYKNLQAVTPGGDYSIDEEGAIVPPDLKNENLDERNVKLLEYWNEKTDEYVVIANGVIIRDGPMPDDHKTLPFAVLHMYRRPHTFFSKGVPKLVESIESAYNKMMNATTQATALAFPIITTSEDAGIDPRSIAAYPGIVMEGALDKMRLEQLGSVPSEVFAYAEKLESWLVWVSGVNYQQIFGDKGSDRVGIEALKKESMLSRVNFNLRENESGFIVRTGDIFMQDIQQYYPIPRIRALMPNEDFQDIPLNRQVIDKDTGKVRAILEDRRIPVDPGVKFSEKYNDKEGMFELKAEASDKRSFIIARPEYIRTKAKLDIRPVRPSAMGSSKEAQKLMIQELLSTALDVNGAVSQLESSVDPQTGQPIPGDPIFDIRYLSEKLIESFELPTKKALESSEDDDTNMAQDAVKEMEGLFETFNKKPVSFPKLPGADQEFAQAPEEEQGELISSLG